MLPLDDVHPDTSTVGQARMTALIERACRVALNALLPQQETALKAKGFVPE